jgi:hypothetical protein
MRLKAQARKSLLSDGTTENRTKETNRSYESILPQGATKAPTAKVCCQMEQLEIEQKKQTDRTNVFCRKVPRGATKPQPQKSACQMEQLKIEQKR